MLLICFGTQTQICYWKVSYITMLLFCTLLQLWQIFLYMNGSIKISGLNHIISFTLCWFPLLRQLHVRDLHCCDLRRGTYYLSTFTVQLLSCFSLELVAKCRAALCDWPISWQAAVQTVPKPYNGSTNGTNALPQALTCSLCNAETLISDGVDGHCFII